MNNKVLVELVIPNLEISYDVYIPINKKIGSIVMTLTKIVSELSGGHYNNNEHVGLYSGISGERYSTNLTVIESDIRNGSRIVLM